MSSPDNAGERSQRLAVSDNINDHDHDTDLARLDKIRSLSEIIDKEKAEFNALADEYNAVEETLRPKPEHLATLSGSDCEGMDTSDLSESDRADLCRKIVEIFENGEDKPDQDIGNLQKLSDACNRSWERIDQLKSQLYQAADEAVEDFSLDPEDARLICLGKLSDEEGYDTENAVLDTDLRLIPYLDIEPCRLCLIPYLDIEPCKDAVAS